MLNQIDLSRVDLNLLVLFETMVAEQSVARAATRLRISPSAVSHGLGRLRRTLNDPLFLKNPRGMVPTKRAVELSAPIADILSRARAVMNSVEQFEPATSSRRFTIGAPDGISAVILPHLFSAIERAAPRIDLAEHTIRPQNMFALLDSYGVDIVIGPVIEETPARFEQVKLFDEDFVISMRAGHALAQDLRLEDYCDAPQLLVSAAGESNGFVDEILSAQGMSRRVAYVAPNFMLALAILAETDLIAALPRRFAEKYCKHFGLALVEPPLPLESYEIAALVPKAAIADDGIAWLFDLLGRVARSSRDNAFLEQLGPEIA
jgi:DNA-binding transcriptional LysR family regulator